MAIHVIVSSMAGEVLVFDLHDNTTVGELKAEVAQRASVPKICQKLVLGTAVLEDEQKMCQLKSTSSENTMDVMMTVSLEEIMNILQHRRHDRTQEALAALSTMGPRGGELAMTTVQKCMKDWNSTTRSCAIEAFARMVDPGDISAIETLRQCLEEWIEDLARSEDTNHRVICAALKALTKIAIHPNERVKRLILECAEDRASHVRAETMNALAEHAQKGDPQVEAAVLAGLRDKDAEVRASALHALPTIVHQGNPQAIQAVKAMLRDYNLVLRSEALMLLKRWGPRRVSV